MAATSWEYGWQWRAACRGEDANLFFPPNHVEEREARLLREQQAKAICATCPVRIECLEYAAGSRTFYRAWPAPVRGAFYAILIFVLLMGLSNAPAQFIYFQF